MRMTRAEPPTAADEADIRKMKDQFLELRIETKRKEADARTQSFQAVKEREKEMQAEIDWAASDYKNKRAALEKELKEVHSSGEKVMKNEQAKVERSLKKIDAQLKKK